MINVTKCGICGCNITEYNPYEAYDEKGNDACKDILDDMKVLRERYKELD